jgi:hypothetical protein
VGDDASSSSVCDVSESEDHNYDGSVAVSPTYGDDFGGENGGIGIDEVGLGEVLEDADGDSGDPMDDADPGFKDQEDGNGGDDEGNEDEGNGGGR